MKDRVSALMDGELDDRSAAATIQALSGDREALATWRTYHLISDSMRDRLVLSEDFTARLSRRLAAEPTVLAPRRIRPESRVFTWSAAAASVAAVGFVGWMAFGPQTQVVPVAQVKAPAEQPAVRVPLPTAANDYLLAHQGFSPRPVQGMAPYVLTVSEHPSEARK